MYRALPHILSKVAGEIWAAISPFRQQGTPWEEYAPDWPHLSLLHFVETAAMDADLIGGKDNHKKHLGSNN